MGKEVVIMAHIINFEHVTIDSLYEQLQAIIQKQKETDTNRMKSNYGDDIEEYLYQMESLEMDYQLYQKRLEFVKKVDEKDETVKQQYLETIYKIDDCDTFGNKVKMMMMLSYGVLVNNFKFIHEKTTEELFMLSFCSSGLYLDIEPGEAPDLDDYTFYIGVLSDRRVAATIVSKTDDFGSQIDIAYAVMDKMDELCPEHYLDYENFEVMVCESLNVINQYEVKQNKQR